MKAIVCKKYGTPDNVKLVDVKKPAPNDNEVLVKIYVASINAADIEHLKGTTTFINPKKLLLITNIYNRREYKQ